MRGFVIDIIPFPLTIQFLGIKIDHIAPSVPLAVQNL
jgi:hypothetical protein